MVTFDRHYLYTVCLILFFCFTLGQVRELYRHTGPGPTNWATAYAEYSSLHRHQLSISAQVSGGVFGDISIGEANIFITHIFSYKQIIDNMVNVYIGQ